MVLNSGAPVVASYSNAHMTWWSNTSVAAKQIGASSSNNMFRHGCVVIQPVLIAHGEAQVIVLKMAEVGLKQPHNFACHMKSDGM